MYLPLIFVASQLDAKNKYNPDRDGNNKSKVFCYGWCSDHEDKYKYSLRTKVGGSALTAADPSFVTGAQGVVGSTVVAWPLGRPFRGFLMTSR